MTTTDKYEATLTEASLHHEGTNGFIAERVGRIAVIETRVSAIHAEVTALNHELADISGLAWAYRCDIESVK